jgi:hypothetical protein
MNFGNLKKGEREKKVRSKVVVRDRVMCGVGGRKGIGSLEG